jgi:hypothetical protein
MRTGIQTLRSGGRWRRQSAGVALPVALASALVVSSTLLAGPIGRLAADGRTSPVASLYPAPVQCEAGLLGDVTGDDLVDLGDAQQILRAAVGLSVTPTVEGRLASHGDVTGDDLLDLGDAQQVLRFAVALSVSFPIGEPLCSGGDVVVRNQTSGPLPGSPYTVSLDGGTPVDMPAGTPSEPGFAPAFTGVPDGEHSVTLGNVPGSCAVVGGLTQNFTLGPDGVLVNFAINCS